MSCRIVVGLFLCFFHILYLDGEFSENSSIFLSSRWRTWPAWNPSESRDNEFVLVFSTETKVEDQRESKRKIVKQNIKNGIENVLFLSTYF